MPETHETVPPASEIDQKLRAGKIEAAIATAQDIIQKRQQNQQARLQALVAALVVFVSAAMFGILLWQRRAPSRKNARGFKAQTSQNDLLAALLHAPPSGKK